MLGRFTVYKYNIEFQSTAAHGNADCLSRLPLSNQATDGLSPEPTIFGVSQIASLPVTAVQLQKATQNNLILSNISGCTTNGWPQEVDGTTPLLEKATRAHY